MKNKIALLTTFIILVSLLITMNVIFHESLRSDFADIYNKQQVLVSKGISSSIETAIDREVGELKFLSGILSEYPIDDKEKIKEIMKEEFQELLDNYGDKRKTTIVARGKEIEVKDLIKNEQVIVTITHKGYIKRMANDTYRAQKRGGSGVKGAASTDDDFFTDIFTANTHATILFFTSKGQVFSKKVYDIPEGVRTAKGRNLANLLPIASTEKIKEIIAIDDENKMEGMFLVFATERGLIKRSSYDEYVRIQQNGLRAIKILDSDSLLGVRVTDGKKDVLLCSSSGKIIRFAEDDCRVLGRVSQGMKGINLSENEKVIGMETIDDSVEIFSITDNGYGKRTGVSQYRKQSRGGKGILAMKLTEKTGEIISIKPVTDSDDLMIITDKGQVIRIKISGISLIGRTTQGVRLIRLKEGEKVVAVENFCDPESESETENNVKINEPVENLEIVEFEEVESVEETPEEEK